MKTIIDEKKKHTKEIARHSVVVYERTLEDLTKLGFDRIPEKKVFLLECGARYYFASLASAYGARVTAVDLVYYEPDFLPIAFVRSAIHDGIKPASRSTIRKLLFVHVEYPVACHAGSTLEQNLTRRGKIPKYPVSLLLV